MKSIKTFDNIFNFFYYKYFLKITFESIYLLDYKIYIFMNFFKIIKFTRGIKRLRFLIKYCERVMH